MSTAEEEDKGEEAIISAKATTAITTATITETETETTIRRQQQRPEEEGVRRHRGITTPWPALPTIARDLALEAVGAGAGVDTGVTTTQEDRPHRPRDLWWDNRLPGSRERYI